MAGWHRALGAVGAVVLTGTVLAGCSGGSDGDAPSDAGSAAASRAASAASSLASEGADAVASATAEAGRWLAEIQEGADVEADVRLGEPETAADGRTTVEVTVRNTADSAKSFAVQVNLTDADGTLRDTVVVTVPDVGAGESARATARSSHDLPGEVRAVVARAVRY
ncbi:MULTISPECIES: FxLYD domain-containing protein [unclassified Streptomyces]|uniref:FxLYD domain-containing protein n=1 Tax=unclassified Streptomyces TaxID=2593676 RepID=UPI0023499B52|nr:FxLYD domain-containing protein [Streptomyces sp. M92]WCN02160.1 FxLYD domain-containing protein [Streptomyces sp. M92]